jgi:hypothetical protein
MSYVQRIPATLRTCLRACALALATLLAAFSTWGASPGLPFAPEPDGRVAALACPGSTRGPDGSE